MKPSIATARPDVRVPARWGGLVAFAFFGLFGGWSALAPLSTAAIAPGEIVVETNRKTVQHLEGGIVSHIFVREGDRVRAGQVLVSLDRVQAEAALAMHGGQLHALQAQAARLAAERDGLDHVRFPQDLESRRAADPDIRDILEGQERIFDTRRTALAGQMDILGQRITQLEAQIAGTQAQLAATQRQRALIVLEIEDAEKLMGKGLMPRPRVLELKRQSAALDGTVGQYDNAIAQARQAIGEARMEMIDLNNQRSDNVAGELRDVQTRTADQEQQVISARHVLTRQDIVAPVAGVVVDLKLFTPGGVVAPGQALMDIVPEAETLSVTARIRPTDIDVVAPGLPAQVQLTAYPQRTTPPLDGVLAQLSADRLTDPRTGEAYYSGRIDIDRRELVHLPAIHLTPGMPVQAMIVTGQRTLFDYLTAPLRNSLGRSFRED